jgi:hypothetical protein
MSSYSEDAAEVGEEEFISTYLEAFSWLKIAAVGFVCLLAVGFAVDQVAGPLNQQTKFFHTITGLFGALSFIYATVVVAIALVGAIIVYRESRVR